MSLRHYLEVDDLTPAELHEVLDASEKPQPTFLTGKGVALLFEKPSLRTRHSAEMAVVQLGGHPVYTTKAEIDLDVRESTEDVTRVLSGYYHAIAARVFEHSKLERMAAVSSVPIINLLSDDGHPVQALADVLTIRQQLGSLRGLTIGWVGDFSNVARSLTLASAMTGMSVRICCPTGYGPADVDLDRARALCTDGATITVHDRPQGAVEGVDVVSTDAWYSMGQEAQKAERKAAFGGFQVDDALMSHAGAEAIFLHCLPAHRGEEVSHAVLEGPRSRVFPQAHNRMHTFRGLLSWLHQQGAIA